MSAYLFIQEGPRSGAVHVLEGEAVLVGRGEDCDVRLEDEFVSRRHFRIERSAAGFDLVDLGSRNATVLNGATQRGRTTLRHGDEIAVGATKLRFSSGAPDVPAANAAAETAGVSRGDPRDVAGDQLIGESEDTARVRAFIERVASADVTVLITGESGTGKEVVARALHATSGRRHGPFVPVNCAAIPRELCESELFGHERGAFSGALSQHAGKFEQAHRGTLFLDEIGELPAPLQAKLLRVLEERSITRIGGSREIAVDVRVIAATNRDLYAMEREGRFRADLIYRLEVTRIELAPLRSRRADIEPLARHFLARCEAERKRGPLALSSEAIAHLAAYDWPGNVRELRNAIERASIFSGASVIGPDALELGRPGGGTTTPPLGASTAVDDAIQAQVERALAQTGGNKKRAAELLKISRSSLYNYLERFKIR